MKKIGFIIPTYPNEKRVAIIPQHISRIKDQCVFEHNFGKNLNIDDSEYIKAGATISSKENIFETCDYIFSLKLIQQSDYKHIKQNQKIIGWIHPTGSGKSFYENQGIQKNLLLVDLDNIYPKLYTANNNYSINIIPRNFIYQNSVNAGIASTMHALMSHGIIPSNKYKIAILGNGNVSQGAFSYISKFSSNVRLFYRKTMNEFIQSIDSYDIIINGIEVDDTSKPIISHQDISRLKRNCFIIDAAADADNTIQGTHYTTIDKPIYEQNGVFYYVVNNAPSILYRQASYDISDSLSTFIFNKDCQRFFNIANL